MPGHLLIFGEGYTGKRLRAALEAEGWRVTGTGRSLGPGRLIFDGGAALPAEALAGITHVLSSVPPDTAGDPALRLHAEALAGLESLEWAGYLSTTGVYGNHDGGWVDETTLPAPTAARSGRRLLAEQAWLDWGRRCGKTAQIFRLAGIYGPGRGPFSKVRAGTARRIIKKGQVFSRIHVEDIAQILAASIARPNPGAIYNMCDDDPAPPQDVIAHAAELLGMPLPPEVDFETAEMTPMARSFYAESKRVRNDLIKFELGVKLLFPDYRAGLASLLELERRSGEV